MRGPRARVNSTPLEPAFPCVASKIKERGEHRLTIAVGDIKDYTGKYSQMEGSTITQGGALMVYSALGKLGNAIEIAERFDTRIAELELAYMDRRQLGDGRTHSIPDGNGGSQVPWLPYFGGSILKSDYYIVGGITELNYNIQSGGFEAAINNIGAKKRTYTMSIGADLRIVDTKTLRVMKTVSLQKQITGEEVGTGIFRFFGDELFDISLGAKNQEPLQLGVRTVLEQATLELVGAVTSVFAPTCIYKAQYSPELRDAAAMRVAVAAELARQERAAQSVSAGAAPSPGAKPAPGSAPKADPASLSMPATGAKPTEGQQKRAPSLTSGKSATVNAGDVTKVPLQLGDGNHAGGAKLQVAFDFGVATLDGRGIAAVARLAAEAAKGPANFEIIASDSESWSPQKREELTRARIRAIVDALNQHGVASSRVRTTWMPAASDTGITRDGAGFQVFARLRITPP